MKCDVPPTGWLCTREAGHSGPCAAYRILPAPDQRDYPPPGRSATVRAASRRFAHWLRYNARHMHHRWMARFLRRRGWVAFYLEQPHRECRSVCWMDCYAESERMVKG